MENLLRVTLFGNPLSVIGKNLLLTVHRLAITVYRKRAVRYRSLGISARYAIVKKFYPFFLKLTITIILGQKRPFLPPFPLAFDETHDFFLACTA